MQYTNYGVCVYLLTVPQAPREESLLSKLILAVFVTPLVLVLLVVLWLLTTQPSGAEAEEAGELATGRL
jgi:hypothetical protein